MLIGMKLSVYLLSSCWNAAHIVNPSHRSYMHTFHSFAIGECMIIEYNKN